MIILNVIIVILLLFGISFHYLKAYRKKLLLDKEHILFFVFPLSDWIVNRIRPEKVWKQSIHKKELINVLYPTNSGTSSSFYWNSRISIAIVILLIFNIIEILSFSAKNTSLLKDEYYLERPSQGTGSKKIDLDVVFEDLEEMEQDKKKSESQKISIYVKEKAYTEEEIEKFFEEGYQFLQEKLLGSNLSLDRVEEDLNLLKRIPGSLIKVEWKSSDYSLIQSDGVVHNQKVETSGKKVALTAILSLQEKKREYNWEVMILPRRYSKEEERSQNLISSIKELSQSTLGEAFQKLPGQIKGYRIYWTEKKKEHKVNLLLLGLILCVVSWILSDKDTEKQLQKRKQQMEQDYPEIINKFTLLINAGMTIKQAWSKIIEDYKSKRSDLKLGKRYAYEEMIITANEMKLGVSEQIAYEQFGKKVGLIIYIKFSSLLSQNLKKGTKGFTDLLVKEAENAFEMRKHNARRLGEEAGTKLLIPMMILLIIVFVIIMFPAFRSFQM